MILAGSAVCGMEGKEIGKLEEKVMGRPSRRWDKY